MIPPGRPLRVVGDVHGDSRGFAMAVETDRFIVQLGDLVDDGPDTPGALKLMFSLLDEKRGIFLLGNHDFKLARALRGDKVSGEPLARTLGGTFSSHERSRIDRNSGGSGLGARKKHVFCTWRVSSGNAA